MPNTLHVGRDGTRPNQSRETKVFRGEQGQVKNKFPGSADQEQDWQPYIPLFTGAGGYFVTTPNARVGPKLHLLWSSPTYSRVWINRVRFKSCSWSAEQDFIFFFQSPFAPEHQVSRDGFGPLVPRQPAHSPYSG